MVKFHRIVLLVFVVALFYSTRANLPAWLLNKNTFCQVQFYIFVPLPVPGHIVTGTSFGKLCIWRIDHVLKSDKISTKGSTEEQATPHISVSKDEIKQQDSIVSAPFVEMAEKGDNATREEDLSEMALQKATPKNNIKLPWRGSHPVQLRPHILEQEDPTFQYICRVLTKQSPEGIRGIYLDTEGTILCVVGDIHYLYWGSLQDVVPVKNLFRRSFSHTFKSCDDSNTLVSDSKVIILTIERKGYWEDMVTKSRREVNIQLGHKDHLVGFNGELVVVKRQVKKKTFEAVVYSLEAKERLRIRLSSSHNSDWGFYLIGELLNYYSSSFSLLILLSWLFLDYFCDG